MLRAVLACEQLLSSTAKDRSPTRRSRLATTLAPICRCRSRGRLRALWLWISDEATPATPAQSPLRSLQIRHRECRRDLPCTLSLIILTNPVTVCATFDH